MYSSGGQNAKVLADIYAEHRNRPQLYPNVKRVPNEFQLLRKRVNSLSNRTALSFMKDLMRSLIAEALAGSMIQYFHGGCKYLRGNISKV